MRALLPKSQWTKLRKAVLERQGLQCAVCGERAAESRKLQAHEKWDCDDSSSPSIAHLVTISLVCWYCHAVEHWGVTKTLVAKGQLTEQALTDTIAHFCRVNGATLDDFAKHEEQETRRWQERSSREWRIDYGPFLGWVAASFEHDPLNEIEWSSELGDFGGRDSPASLAEIVKALPE